MWAAGDTFLWQEGDVYVYVSLVVKDGILK